MEKKCSGCGARLQCSNPEAGGYLPSKVLESNKLEDLICQRCYRIRHYARLEKVNLGKEDYWEIVKDGIKKGEVIVKVVDIIDFAGTWDQELIELFGSKPWILAINKVDLLPEHTRTNQIYKWVQETLEKKKIKPPTVVRLLSSKERFGISKLKDDLKQLVGPKRKVTVVGTTNVGKSSLLNQLVGQKEDRLTISKFPGTTLGLAAVFLAEEKIDIFDTPGVIPRGRLSDLLCPQCNLLLIPSQEISRKTYKLEVGQAVMFGGVASFQVVEEENRPIILAFAAQGVKFHRTRAEKVEEIREKHGGDWLVPPCSACDQAVFSVPWEKQQITLVEGEDLAIAGLGWISVRRGPAILEIETPAGVKLDKRRALVAPFENKINKPRRWRRN